MPLPSPNLDDRRFADLLAEAREIARVRAPASNWTDFSPHDPGMVLLELFAHLTELLIYRLNRVPEKAYVEFLNLAGVKLYEPVAAMTRLQFRLPAKAAAPVFIRRGTRVTVRDPRGAEAPVFSTREDLTIPAGATSAEVTAVHAELVEGELAAVATGRPGMIVRVKRPPLVAPTGDPEGLDLAVRVEVTPGEPIDRSVSVQFNGKTYRTWREVAHFSEPGDDPYAYVADRNTGSVTFAPAARSLQANGGLADAAAPLAAVPPAGREIRLWYRRGGGPAGNVDAGTLVTLKGPVPGVTLAVTNPAPATGGREAESVQNAMDRGPQTLYALHRAVTARDFELLARRNNPGAVARARAVTQAEVWKHARPGTVEVLLVPTLPAADRGDGGGGSQAGGAGGGAPGAGDGGGAPVTAALLRSRQTAEARQRIQADLDARRPIGTACVVNWVRYKTVRVRAGIAVAPGEDAEAVLRRVRAALYRRICPLPDGSYPGWPFGQTLRVSHVFDIALAEPGVAWVDDVRFVVDEVPRSGVSALAADHFQPHTWYAGSGPILYRSLNDGAGWEPAGRFDAGEAVRWVEAHPEQPGMLAVAAEAGGGQWRLHLSADCGETWPEEWTRTTERITDLAWMKRDGRDVLLIAGEKGLRTLVPGESPAPLAVREGAASGVWAVTAARDQRDRLNVAVALMNRGGVFLSRQGGAPGTFEPTGLTEDVRRLHVQTEPGNFVWAAIAAGGTDRGLGAFRWNLDTLANPAEGWQRFDRTWKGGYCRALAFDGTRVYAGTQSEGVLRLDTGAAAPAWESTAALKSGLPLSAGAVFSPVDVVAVNAVAITAVATNAGGDAGATKDAGRIVMAGGQGGVYRSTNRGVTFVPSVSDTFTVVTLPDTWLFCSGQHEIEQVTSR